MINLIILIFIFIDFDFSFVTLAWDEFEGQKAALQRQELIKIEIQERDAFLEETRKNLEEMQQIQAEQLKKTNKR